MNQIPAQIYEIEENADLFLIRSRYGELEFSSLYLGLPDQELAFEPGDSVMISFKENEVIIGHFRESDDELKIPAQISLRNRIKAKISRLEIGKILARVHMQAGDISLSSVITRNAVEQLRLSEGITVWAMIKTNEMIIEKR
jgi:molybdate transport system regulatory protein